MKELVKELKAWVKCFESTINYQKYDVNVFDALNKRYIESKKLIEKYENAHNKR